MGSPARLIPKAAPLTATAPSDIVLAPGSSNPVGGVVNVAIPAAGGTDTSGSVSGWITATADKIKFTVTDGGTASSSITINGSAYTSGADYQIVAATPLTIVVTTTETGRLTQLRTFTVSVAAALPATAPSAVVLAPGSSNPVGGVVNVAIPAAGGTDTSGSVSGWITATADKIKFTVTDGGTASSSITINGGAYANGADYTIGAATPLTIVVTTTETGRLTQLRTFTVSVAAALPATAPSAVVLAPGSSNPVGGVVNVAIPAAGGTDTSGSVSGWITATADKIKFTVTDGGTASSSITINGSAYTSGADYQIVAATPLTIVVTTTETGRLTQVRSFTVSVAAMQYTVIFAVDGGTAVPDQTVTHGSKASLPTPAPTKPGYDFVNWYAESDLINIFDFANTTITVNTIIYAKWSPGDCTLTYDGNGNDGGTAPGSSTYTNGVGTMVAGVGTLTRSGCTFIGWNTAANWTGTDYAAGADLNIAGNATLYAKWRLDTPPAVANLGFRYFDAYLEVTGSALPAYTTLEIFIKAADPLEQAAGSGEAKYTLDLTNASNRDIGWHNVGSSPGISVANSMWYRYVYGSAKSDWVQDGLPLGFMPEVYNAGNPRDYGYTKTGSTTLTMNNAGGELTGMTLLIYRGGTYNACTPTISGVNATYTAPVTLATGDVIVVRNPNGNYSYHSSALP